VSNEIPEFAIEVANKNNLMPDGMTTIWAGFAPHFKEFKALATSAKTIDEKSPKAARAMRLELKAVRIASEKTRKSLKEDSLRRGKAIDAMHNVLEYELAPVEQAMEDIEKAEERAEAARKEALRVVRAKEIEPFADPLFYDLANMPDGQWVGLLTSLKAAHEAKIAAEKEAELQRLRKAKEEAEERERLRQENERLAAEAAKARAAQEAERKKAEQAAAKARAEQERIRQEAIAEAQRIEAQHAKERQRLEAEAQRLKAEAQKKAEAEAKARRAEQERIEKERAEEERAAAAPDREKLIQFATALLGLDWPVMASSPGKEAVKRLKPMVLNVYQAIKKTAELL
jgi:hypothetical protein